MAKFLGSSFPDDDLDNDVSYTKIIKLATSYLVAVPETKLVPLVEMKETTNSGQPVWNGAEQLFQAAKDYGITVCFANPGTISFILHYQASYRPFTS